MKNQKIVTALQNPGREYRAKPFWSWNGDLKEEELKFQIDAMKEMGFGGFFIHSRTGLITEYLGDEWFRLVRACVEYGNQAGMESWLYDEDRWPSGTCGGIVTEKTENRMRFISEYDSDEAALSAPDTERVLARYALRFEGDLLADARLVSRREDVPEGYEYRVYAEERMAPQDFYNGAAYLDTMNERAVQEYLHSTHDVYAEKCGDLFGNGILGIFTDEPHRGAAFSGFGIVNENRMRMLPYTAAAFGRYREKYGEDVSIPDLYYYRVGKTESEAAFRYLDVLDELFTQNYAKQYSDWCKNHGLLMTGHVLQEDSLREQTSLSGSMMRFYEYMDCPGIDNLGLYNGSYRAVIQCASVARQTGKKFVLSELYGCTGWDMPLREYKRIGDWQALFGVNLRCPHLSWYSMQGEAKRDYPASILHQNAWYKDWNLIETYFGRLGVVLTEGERSADLLVLHPVEQMWRFVRKDWLNIFDSEKAEVNDLDERFYRQSMQLIENQVEFDYGDEELIAKYGEVGCDGQGAYFRIGKATYRQVLSLPDVKWRQSTLRLLEKFVQLGGCVTEDPQKVRSVFVEQAPKNVTCAVRFWQGEYWLFALNLQGTETQGDLLVSAALSRGCAEEWDFTQLKNLGKADLLNLHFAPDQMRIFRFTQSPAPQIVGKGYPLAVLPKKMEYDLGEPNALVLDSAAAYLNGEEFCAAEDVLLLDRALRDRFGLTYRGGEMVQPWFAAKYQGEEPQLGTLRLVYRFHSDIEAEFSVAAEYAEIQCNGSAGRLTEQRWVDSAFNVFAVRVKKGENVLTSEFAFRPSSNVEAVYVLGRFGVTLPDRITALPQYLTADDITAQGFPFYSGSITYHTGLTGKLRVAFPNFGGTTLHILGGKEEDILFLPPFEEEIDAESELCLKAYFTRRNTFGPLHLTPQPQGAYGPFSWVNDEENRSETPVLIPQGLSVHR